MLGIILTFVGSILLIIADAGKKALTKHASLAVIIWTILAMGIIVNGACLALTGFPEIEWDILWQVLPISIALFVVSELLFMQATKTADFSLAQPFKAFAPVLALPLAYVLLDEKPPPLAFVGVLLVVLGTYLLFVPAGGPGNLLLPLKALANHPTPRLMLACQLGGVMLLNLQKLGAASSSPLLYVTLVFLGVWILFSLYLFAKHDNPFKLYRSQAVLALGTGALWAIGLTMLFAAVQYTLVSYVAVIEQFQPIFSIPLGYFIFKEQESMQRLWPCIIMIVGVLFIVV